MPNLHKDNEEWALAVIRHQSKPETHGNPQVVSFMKALICIRDNGLRLNASQNVNKPPEQAESPCQSSPYNEKPDQLAGCKASITSSTSGLVEPALPARPPACLLPMLVFFPPSHTAQGTSGGVQGMWRMNGGHKESLKSKTPLPQTEETEDAYSCQTYFHLAHPELLSSQEVHRPLAWNAQLL